MEPLRVNQKPDAIALFSYFLAAAILIPMGWWMKAHWVPALAAWSRGWFH